MTDSSFREARLKIERANQHIRDFEAKAASFFDSTVYEIGIESDPESNSDFIEIAATQTIPDSFALILGDAIHNLRSALDLAWFEIAGRDSPDPDREIFPVRHTHKHLEEFIKGRPEHQSLVQLADTLLNVIQPYKGGNGDDIWRLHRLDIEDKHRVLIERRQVGELTGLWAEDDKGERFGIKKGIILDGQPLMIRRTGSTGLKIVKEGYLTGTIVFGKGTPVPGQLILPALRRFDVVVRGTLKTLEPFA